MRSIVVGTEIILILQRLHRIEQSVTRTDLFSEDVDRQRGEIRLIDNHLRKRVDTDVVRNGQSNVTGISVVRIERNEPKMQGDKSKRMIERLAEHVEMKFTSDGSVVGVR